MEDKFGYLMKQEFEEDFLEQIRDLMKENPNMSFTPMELHDRVVLTWGGKHSKDISDVAKMR